MTNSQSGHEVMVLLPCRITQQEAVDATLSGRKVINGDWNMSGRIRLSQELMFNLISPERSAGGLLLSDHSRLSQDTLRGHQIQQW